MSLKIDRREGERVIIGPTELITVEDININGTVTLEWRGVIRRLATGDVMPLPYQEDVQLDVQLAVHTPMKVRLAFYAPKHVLIDREEIRDQRKQRVSSIVNGIR